MRNVKLRSGTLKSGGTTLSLISVYILMCTVFSILSPYFLKVKNFTNILVYMSITGVMAAGVTVTMLLGAMDISQYAIATMASVVAARIIKSGASPLPYRWRMPYAMPAAWPLSPSQSRASRSPCRRWSRWRRSIGILWKRGMQNDDARTHAGLLSERGR